MSVVVTCKCDGCDAETVGTGRLKMEFVSFSGRDHGFGTRRWVNTPDSVAPEGWIASDPYTGCCYCPACWDEIMAPKEARDA